MGFFEVIVASLVISLEMVALKRMVCTYSRTWLIICLISASKPSSNNLSASSNTIISRFYIPILLEFMTKSMILPGVVMTTSGLFLSACYCLWIELPPMTKQASSLVNLLSLSNSSWIWIASSLVGVTIKALM